MKLSTLVLAVAALVAAPAFAYTPAELAAGPAHQALVTAVPTSPSLLPVLLAAPAAAGAPVATTPAPTKGNADNLPVCFVNPYCGGQ